MLLHNLTHTACFDLWIPLAPPAICASPPTLCDRWSVRRLVVWPLRRQLPPTMHASLPHSRPAMAMDFPVEFRIILPPRRTFESDWPMRLGSISNRNYSTRWWRASVQRIWHDASVGWTMAPFRRDCVCARWAWSSRRRWQWPSEIQNKEQILYVIELYSVIYLVWLTCCNSRRQSSVLCFIMRLSRPTDSIRFDDNRL